MSSKSRKHSQKSSHAPAQRASDPAHAGAKKVEGELEYAEPSEKDFLEDDLKTPKGRNPLTYAFMILLLIFLTVIFILPPTAGSGGGGRENPVAVRWNDPTLGPRELTLEDLYDVRARYETTLENGGAAVVRTLVARGFVSDPDRPSEADLVRLVMADQQALAAGVHVSDAELAAVVRQLMDAFGGPANYEQRLRYLTHIGGVRGFEETLRSLMRINRFVELSAMAASVPARAAIEEAWHEAHREFRFEWARADVAAFDEAARAEEPSDEDLQAYLDGLTDFERAQYRTSATYTAELVGLVLDEGDRDLSALEARYPRPDEWDGAAEADRFYKDRYFVIYQRPQPEEGAEGEGAEEGAEDAADEGDADEDQPLYYTFEEVQGRVERDARAFAALRDWHTELVARVAAGEEIDLEAEAAALGLDYVKVEEPLDIVGWRELGGLSNQIVAGRVASLSEAGQLSPSVVVGGTGLTVVRLIDRTEPTLPPAAELRDRLLEPYYEQRRTELARETIADLRERLLADPDGEEGPEEAPTTVTAEAFRAAAEEAGLTVGVRDWLDRRATQADDPNWEDPVHTLVRSNPRLFDLAEGGLSGVLSPFGELDAMYLVRAAGSREMDFERITPRAFAEARGRAQGEALATYYTDGPFSDRALRDSYALWLRSEELEAQEAAEGQQGS